MGTTYPEAHLSKINLHIHVLSNSAFNECLIKISDIIWKMKITVLLQCILENIKDNLWHNCYIDLEHISCKYLNYFFITA